jgi:hypothetical protein
MERSLLARVHCELRYCTNHIQDRYVLGVRGPFESSLVSRELITLLLAGIQKEVHSDSQLLTLNIPYKAIRKRYHGRLQEDLLDADRT